MRGKLLIGIFLMSIRIRVSTVMPPDPDPAIKLGQVKNVQCKRKTAAAEGLNQECGSASRMWIRIQKPIFTS
jgi:hypothetical protein